MEMVIYVSWFFLFFFPQNNKSCVVVTKGETTLFPMVEWLFSLEGNSSPFRNHWPLLMAMRSGKFSPSPTQPAQNLIPTQDFDGFQGPIDKWVLLEHLQ
jgi:hypothetical protein